MARKIRMEYAGAVYHVMARGNQGRAVFADDRDRMQWLETLGEACAKTGWRIHAYVLMGNHYHLLVETPEANLVAGMKWLQGTYTRRQSRARLIQRALRIIGLRSVRVAVLLSRSLRWARRFG